MRILAVHPSPAFSVADVFVGWTEALRDLGQQVARYNLDERMTFYAAAHIERDGAFQQALSADEAKAAAVEGLLSACYKMQPDVLLVVSGFFTPNRMLDLIRARGTKVVLIHTESPYQDDEQVDRAQHADLNLINDPTNLHAFPPNTYYQPHCYRPGVHHPADVEPQHRSDFAFVGTGYPSRIRFLEAVDWTGLDVALAGNWQALEPRSPLRKFLAHDIAGCCDNAEAVNLYRGAKVNANLYRREADRPELSAGWACGPREIELAATGCFFLRDPRGESDELFPMLPTFTGPEDFGEQVRWWARHDLERKTAAALAREAVADRTFTNAAKRLLRLLDA